MEPDLLEAMVFLESAGRPDAMASSDLEGAVGLAQILAGTATTLLGMHVDVEASKSLTRALRRAERRERFAEVERLQARRRKIDERFDAGKSLDGAGRYLAMALERFGRPDLAVVSYHMGMGNLEQVLDAYGERDVSYARVFFDATPARHPRTYRLLAGLGDDSKTYLWRVYAAREIMRLWREDRDELERLARLQTAKASGEEVLHPREDTTVFEDPGDLEDAYDAGTLRPFAASGRGLRADPRMGELAARLDTERSLYRGLRPEAHALAAYLAAGVRSLARTRAPLIVTSTVRDLSYQRLLARENLYATRAYSLHTTGFAFDAAPALPLTGAGRGIPVHARPPPVAEPDRLGAGAGSDPHHGFRRGGRAGSLVPRASFARTGMASSPPTRYSSASRSTAARILLRVAGVCFLTRPAVRTLPPSSPRQSASASGTRCVSDTEWTSTSSRPAPSRSARNRWSSARR